MTAVAATLLLNRFDLALGQGLKKAKLDGDHPIPYEAKLDPVFYYTKATFTPYVGTSFRARGQGRDEMLTLVAVRDCGVQPTTKLTTVKARPTDCFALRFSAMGPLTEITTIHQLDHGALGKFHLFLTRSEDEQGHLFYEAIINHAL